MDIQSLKNKYQNQKVMVIPAELTAKYPQYGFMSCLAWGKSENESAEYVPITWAEIDVLFQAAKPMYRYEAELDENFRQIIPYVVIRDNKTRKIFCTKRLAGDSRLVGQVSIGTGGHMEPNEILAQTMFRELDEEVGLADTPENSYRLIGMILDDSTEVSRVHIGFCMLLDYYTGEVCVKETNKLEGMWMTPEEIEKEPKLESWSRILLPYVK